MDYAVARVESGRPVVFVSGKTGSICNEDPKQRDFNLDAAPNKRFCNVVVASYAGALHKVAVMCPDTAYVEGRTHFCWNDNHLKPGVRVFDTPESRDQRLCDLPLSAHASARLTPGGPLCLRQQARAEPSPALPCWRSLLLDLLQLIHAVLHERHAELLRHARKRAAPFVHHATPGGAHRWPRLLHVAELDDVVFDDLPQRRRQAASVHQSTAKRGKAGGTRCAPWSSGASGCCLAWRCRPACTRAPARTRSAGRRACGCSSPPCPCPSPRQTSPTGRSRTRRRSLQRRRRAAHRRARRSPAGASASEHRQRASMATRRAQRQQHAKHAVRLRANREP